MDNELEQEPELSREAVDALVRERDEALARAELAEQESFLLQKGVAAGDLDYYIFKIGKLAGAGDGDFRAAAEQFLRSRPARTETPARVDTAAPLGGGGRTISPNDAMNALIRGARK